MRLSLLFIFVLQAINTFAAPISGRIGPYSNVRGIRTDLRRYGLEAGVYSAPDGRRVSFLLRRAKVSRPEPLPLLLYLPGSGEVGTDLSRQFAQRTIFERVCSPEFQSRHPCHFLALSSPDGVTTLLGGAPGHPTADQSLLMSVVDTVAATCTRPPVDTNRLYATGLSFGGNGVYALATRFPGRFAAILPVAALPPDGESLPSGLPTTACWHFYNEGDYRRAGISAARLDEFAALVRRAGGDFRVGPYPDRGHDAWSKAWREDAAWNWMFSKRADGGGTQSAAPPPKAICTASVPGADDAHGPDRAADGLDATCYVSRAPVSRGDWWMAEFAAPVTGRVSVLTGTREGRGRLTSGFVEVSSDGRNWTRAGKIQRRTGTAAFDADGIRFLRVLPEPPRPEVLTLREVRIGGE